MAHLRAMLSATTMTKGGAGGLVARWLKRLGRPGFEHRRPLPSLLNGDGGSEAVK
jgi:hypothetical protein